MGKFKITQSPASKNIFLYPADNGCVNDCFPFGDMPNYRCVDDLQDALEPESTYVWMEGESTVSELYTMENHGTLTGTINYVKAHCKAKNDRYAPHVDAVYKIAIAQNSDCSLFATSNNMPLCTGYGLFEYAWIDNPWTDTDWTWDEIDALQAGFECSSPSVIMTPFHMLPIADGDRTDITNVTTGYEHWEAVEKEQPYSEVFESGAAWKYDLYDFIHASNDPLTYSDAARGHLYHNNYMFACCLADGLYVHKLNDDNKFEFILRQNDGKSYQSIDTDGTYYYVATATGTYVYSFDGETLTELDSIATGSQIVRCHGSYIYVGESTDIAAYTFNGSTLSIVDTQAVTGNVAGIYHDGSYVYVSTGAGMLYAMSFNGTVFAIIDSDNKAFLLGENLYGIDGDGTYIYAPAMTDGIYAYSFDGATLTFITDRDDGNTYKSVACYNGYIFVPIDGANDELIVYTFDGVAFSAILATHTFGLNAHTMWEIHVVDGLIICDWTSQYLLTFSGSGFAEITNTAEDNTPPYLDDNIESVTVVAKMGKDPSADDQADIRGCFNIKTGGSEFNTSAEYYTLESKQRYYAYTWTENPDTAAAWTLAEVQALQAGIGLYGDGTHYATCSKCFIVIGTTTNISPEIHTCQTYLKVNYTPEDTICYMPKPQEISTNHARNVNMLNFWNGEREVYDVNRSGKSMVLTGSITDRLGGGAWCDVDYAFRKKITIDHTQVDEDLTDFPVYLEIDLNNKCLNSSGYDVMFCNGACSEYACEIEDYTDNGILKAWVQIPTVSSTVDTSFWIYYRKSGVTVDPSTTDIWDDAGYTMVQHMSDTDADTITGSTDAGHVGTKQATGTPEENNGVVNKCQYGHGGDTDTDYIKIPDHADLNMEQEKFTFSLWIKAPESQDVAQDIIVKKKSTGKAYFIFRQGRFAVGNYVWLQLYQDAANNGYTQNRPVCCDNTWHMLHYIVDWSEAGNDAIKVYYDGDYLENAQSRAGTPDIIGTEELVMFYRIYSANHKGWNGRLDEVRFAKGTTVSAAWIKAEYNNQKEDSTFVSYGIQQENYVTVLNACNQILCVRDMTRNGTVVNISGLSPVYFNGEYRINSFGWKKIGEKPENYDWILELESAN